MLKTVLKTLAVLFGLVIVFGLVKFKTIKKLIHTIQLFDEDVIVHNFQHMDEVYAVTRLAASDNPYRYPSRLDYRLIGSFQFKDSLFQVKDFFDYTNTEGLLVIHNDTVVYEKYFLGMEENTTHISWSMAKSVVSTLAGIAHDEGLFKLEDKVTDYLPQFKGTGYDGVRIKDVLQMSSGVGFNEDYGDFNSDINRFGRAFALGSSFEKFALSMKREREPGTYCHYVSIDTQVIGMLIAKVTGRTLTSYLEENLWEPLGMESQAEWIIDNEGMELALGGLNMTLRDYAKLGQLYLHNGSFNGKQIVSEKWVQDATTPDASHLMPGNHGQSSHNLGYGYQWWIPEQDEGDFFAAGIYNQYVYVNPYKNLVIAKLSANHHFKKEGAITKDYHIAMFKKMAEDFSNVAQVDEVEM